ncbi:zinc-ribbon domain-containing protein [Lactiplantibacillus garii]|uniref:Zinc-ribbon domain-containing protein n=2 Tax=Lactiplantibacillus garii TaxID=2306423 RepID=A0A3R8LIV9_9LACO|nr:zinc-ribbon domain-containing protein [Lactiplantibacillus garii]
MIKLFQGNDTGVDLLGRGRNMKNAKFCPHCGAELEAGVKFCSKCGYQLTDTVTNQASATQPAADANETKQPQATQTTTSEHKAGDFSARLDAMVNWVTNNWATAIIIIVGLLLFTLITRAMFYNVWLGLVALVAVLLWLYSSAWTNGSGATAFEQKLRHVTQSTVDSVNQTVDAHQANKMMKSTETKSQMDSDTQAQAGATQTSQAAGGNTVYIQQSAQKSNGLGTAGFVLALIGLFTSVIPFVDWVIWFLGALFSFIGLFRQPRGLAIAGFIISFIGVIIILTIATAIAGLLGIGGML